MRSFGFEFLEDLTFVVDDWSGSSFATGQHTHLLLGRKGEAALPTKNRRPPSTFSNQTEVEARKEIYRAIEQICGNDSSKLQVFGVENDDASILGWRYWLSGPRKEHGNTIEDTRPNP